MRDFNQSRKQFDIEFEKSVRTTHRIMWAALGCQIFGLIITLGFFSLICYALYTVLIAG